MSYYYNINSQNGNFSSISTDLIYLSTGSLSYNASTGFVFNNNITTNGTINGNYQFNIMKFQKDDDQTVSGLGSPTFNTTPIATLGTSFGSMGSTGVFTFDSNASGWYQFTYNFNHEGPTQDFCIFQNWDGTSNTQTRYMQFAGSILKGSVAEVIQVAGNDNIRIILFTGRIVYGTGNTKTKFTIQRVA